MKNLLLPSLLFILTTFVTAQTCSITQQPIGGEFCVGSIATISISATGTGLIYQWQASGDSGRTYVNVQNDTTYSGATTEALKIVPRLSSRSQYFRARVVCSLDTLYSKMVYFYPLPPTKITVQTQSQTVSCGESLSFSISANNFNSCQWMKSADNGITYTDIPGETNSYMYLQAVTTAINENLYKVMVNGCGSVESLPALLTVNAAPEIVTQPKDQIICPGATVTLSGWINAGNYQWQISTDGGITFNNLTNSIKYANVTASQLTITGEKDSNFLYRFIAISSCGANSISSVVKLSFPDPAIITTQPVDYTTCKKVPATFSVISNGSSFKWQESIDGGVTYSDLGTSNDYENTNTSTLKVYKDNPYITYFFRVIVGQKCGSKTTSLPVKLTVNEPPFVQISSRGGIFCEGDSIELHASKNYDYLWSPAYGLNVTSGASVIARPTKTTTYTVEASVKGCATSKDSFTVDVLSKPDIELLLFPESYICKGDRAIILPDGGGVGTEYFWTPGNIYSSNGSISFLMDTSTMFIASWADRDGCSGVDSVFVPVMPKPIINFYTDQSTICKGGSVTIKTSETIEYLLQDKTKGIEFMDTRSSIMVQPDTTTIYAVTAWNEFCVSYASKEIKVNSFVSPQLNITNPPLVCKPGTIDLTKSGIVSDTAQTTGSLSYWTDAKCLNSVPNPTAVSSGKTYYVKKTTTDNCEAVKPINVLIINCDVWPGDADANGIADHFDLLPIGIYYNENGPVRTSISTSWEGYPAIDWSGTDVTGVNLKHADCNGDGIINGKDTLAIVQNYGLTHNKMEKTFQYEASNPSLYFVLPNVVIKAGTTVNAEIWAGSNDVPINNLYGLAFSVMYDENIIEQGTTQLSFNNSWLGDKTNTLSLNKSIGGSMDGVLVRTDKMNQNGFGKIGNVQMKIKSTALTGSSLKLRFTDYKAVNAAGTSLSFNPVNSFAITGIYDQNDPALFFNVYPNPNEGSFNIEFRTLEKQEVKIVIINILGEIVLEQQLDSHYQFELPVTIQKSGIYFVKIASFKGIVVKKIVVN